MSYSICKKYTERTAELPLTSNAKVKPSNADEERTYLNRRLIEYHDGVQTRTQAIQHRLETAGLTRKVGKNQVRAIRIMLSGSPDDMQRIVREDVWTSGAPTT